MNSIKPGIIPESKYKRKPRNQFEMEINLAHAINAAKELGISTVNIGSADLMKGEVC
jgi:hypothetical protein